MRKRKPVAVVIGVLAAMAALVASASALASNVSHPATYTGTAMGGGTVEFDVSPDGSAVTRFVVKGVETTCATITESTTMGSIPIVNESFEYAPSTGTRFHGSFSAAQQAQGVLFLHTSFPSCDSSPVSWTATTPTPPPDETPPNAKVSSGPKGTVHSHKATFRFTSTEAGSTFQCKLDGKKWANCKSPKTYKGLKDGKHVFKVKAKDAAGNADPTPATRSWRVD